MPWCDDCSRFLPPNAMGEGGECPSCGRVLVEPVKAPWHFKLLVAACSAYLGWRAIQGVAWVVHRVAG